MRQISKRIKKNNNNWEIKIENMIKRKANKMKLDLKKCTGKHRKVKSWQDQKAVT